MLSPTLSMSTLPFNSYLCLLGRQRYGAPGDGRGPSLRRYWHHFLVQETGWKSEVSQSVRGTCATHSSPKDFRWHVRKLDVWWVSGGGERTALQQRELHSGH